jgi:RHS repeat-associated protein
LYSGEQFDSKIGQQYLRARYYDPATGRFNRIDPFFGNLDDLQSLHKYLYTHGNPVNGIDPSGRSLAGVSISIAIGAGLGALVGGAVSYYDTLLGGGTHTDALGAYWEGFKTGAILGAILGPLHYLAFAATGTVQLLAMVTALDVDIIFGIVGLDAAMESFEHGQWTQGTFRLTTTAIGTWVGIKGVTKVKLGGNKPSGIGTDIEAYSAARRIAEESELFKDAYNLAMDEAAGNHLTKHHNPNSGVMIDMTNGNKVATSAWAKLPPQKEIPPDCLALLEPLGGLGAKKTMPDGLVYTVGNCWEFKSYVMLKQINPALTPDQVRFTESIHPRDLHYTGPCDICKSIFGENAVIPRPSF